MNKEELNLFIELQPRLLEYRGEWQVGDRCYCSVYGVGCVVRIYPSSIAAEVLVKFTADQPIAFGICQPYLNVENLIWLPLPIDPADPERIMRGEKPRGLWNMVNWSKYAPTITVVGQIFIKDRATGEYVTDTLLRALQKQWEV